MTPQFQTKFVIKNSKGEFIQRGNCFAACVASIMDLPITEVPNVEVFYHLDNGYWAEVMHTFVESKGWELCTDERFLMFHCGFKQLNDTSCQNPDNYNRVREIMPDPSKRHVFKYNMRNEYYLASGKSPRGEHSHICIFKAGELIHDPHPSKEGLLSLENFQTLEKQKP